MSLYDTINEAGERVNTFIYEKAQQMGDAVVGALDEWMNRLTGVVSEKMASMRQSLGNTGIGDRLAALNPIPRMLNGASKDSPELAMGISKGLDGPAAGKGMDNAGRAVESGVELPGNEGHNFGHILETSGFSVNGIGHHRNVYGNVHAEPSQSVAPLTVGVESVDASNLGDLSPTASYATVDRNNRGIGIG